MTIDVCTWVWMGGDPWGGSLGEATPSMHNDAMHCVRASLVLGYRSERLGVRIPASLVMRHVGSAPARRAGFVGVDPLAPDATESIEEGVAQGARGVVLSPADQGCRPTNERCLDVLEQCARAGLPVMVTDPGLTRSESVAEYADPLLFDEAARSVTGLTLVFGNAGLVSLEHVLLMAMKHERVFVEVSSALIGFVALYRILLGAHERGVMHKMLFGSGFPRSTPERAIERIYGINAQAGGGIPAIPRESLRGVVERNSLRSLGIEWKDAGPETQRTPREGAGRLPAQSSGQRSLRSGGYSETRA